MKNIKSKIERVEKETKRIEAIEKLITYCEAEHLKPIATFTNGGTFAQTDAVNIDKNIMIQMLAEQKLTIELEIEEDVKFIAAIELLASGLIGNTAANSHAPASPVWKEPLQMPAQAPARR